MSAAILDVCAEHEAPIQFLYLAAVGLVQASLDGEIALINPISAQLLLPLSADGNLANLLAAPADVAPDLHHRVADFDPASGLVCEGLRIQLTASQHGKSDPRMLSLSLLKQYQGRLMGVLNDVARQVAQERLLRQNEAWLSAILTGVMDYALVRLDKLGCVDEWNPSIGRLTGFKREAVFSRPFWLFYPFGGTTSDRVLDRLREADESGWSLDAGWRIKADGTRFWGSALITPLRERTQAGAGDRETVAGSESGDERAYCLVIRDITDQRAASEDQRRATSCDHLTGIANRRSFYEAAEVEIARGRHSPRQLSLVMVDADHFKNATDRHGHPAGDAVQRHLAALLTATFREVEVVARVGGEEFAVLLPPTGPAGAAAVAEGFRCAMAAEPIVVDGVAIGCTVSARVATMDAGSTNLDALIKRADLALYTAKAAGGNRIECASADAPGARD